jgi:hypothetical protein
MTVFVHPVVTDALSNTTEDMAGKMWNTYPGKDKKTQVICDEVEILFPGLNIPANEGVSGRNLPGRGTKEDTGKWVGITVEDDILHIFTHRPAVAKVMVKRKQGVKECLVLVFLNTFDVKRDKCFQTGMNRRLPVLDRMNQPIPKGVVSLGTTWRQSNKAELFQFEKESAACHIFVLAVESFPIPDNAEFP